MTVEKVGEKKEKDFFCGKNLSSSCPGRVEQRRKKVTSIKGTAQLMFGLSLCLIAVLAPPNNVHGWTLPKKPSRWYSYGCNRVVHSAVDTSTIDQHIPIDLDFPGLRRVHQSPDVYVIDRLLTGAECDSIIEEAKKRDMTLSPVAYAGWTEDLKVALRLLPLGVVPVMYSLLDGGMPKWEVGIIGVSLWGALVALFSALATSVAGKRQEELQRLRTSTSTTLPNAEGEGGQAFVLKSQQLMRSSWRIFEAPTVR